MSRGLRGAAVVGATVLACGAGCGRIWFDPIDAIGPDATPDAARCTGDLVVDSADDDPGLSFACQGAGCSLRAAIAIANTRSTTTICVAPDLAIALATQLVVSSDVTITGERTTICGNVAGRVFQVVTGGALRLRTLTVCHGRLVDDSGAAVRVADGGTLDADQVVFDDHYVTVAAVDQEGGAVHGDGNVVIELRRSRFTNNHTERAPAVTNNARGGAFGIRATAAARVLIEDTAFEDNTSTDVGGAMFLVIDGNDLTVDRTLFLRNSSREGAAIDINCAATNTLVFTNSTFVDNVTVPVSASQSVIYVCGTTTARLAFSSFSGNQGAAVNLGLVSSRAEWQASAVHAGAFDACIGAGAGTSLDHNVADHADAVCPLASPNDRVADPLLAPLADNGGPTATLALLPGSPAIDAAGTSCPPTDQRGIVRPVGAACDAGAFEAP